MDLIELFCSGAEKNNFDALDGHIKKHVVIFIIFDFEETADENACLDISRPLSEELFSLKPQNPFRITSKKRTN